MLSGCYSSLVRERGHTLTKKKKKKKITKSPISVCMISDSRYPSDGQTEFHMEVFLEELNPALTDPTATEHYALTDPTAIEHSRCKFIVL